MSADEQPVFIASWKHIAVFYESQPVHSCHWLCRTFLNLWLSQQRSNCTIRGLFSSDHVAVDAMRCLANKLNKLCCCEKALTWLHMAHSTPRVHQNAFGKKHMSLENLNSPLDSFQSALYIGGGVSRFATVKFTSTVCTFLMRGCG